MIQRIQSIFLLLCAGSFGALFAFPFASSDRATSRFLADKLYNIQDHVLLLIMALLGVILAIVSIMMYKNRERQLKLGYLTMVISILLPLLAALLFFNEASNMSNEGRINDEIGIYLPILSLIFAILANRFIKKDENLVKSMDRLR